MNDIVAKPRTKREKSMVSTAYNTGRAEGRMQGIEHGKEVARKELKQEVEVHKAQVMADLLSKAAYFQECITKLVMSMNKDL